MRGRRRGHRIVTARERPDVALVGLGESSDHALGQIDKMVHAAACPVIALLHAPDPAFLTEASRRGVFAHISDDDIEDWQGSIDIVSRRFAEYPMATACSLRNPGLPRTRNLPERADPLARLADADGARRGA